MEYLDSALIVFAVLIAVTIAAVSFEPANPLAKWQQLVESYGTHERPPERQFFDQQVVFGGQRGGLKPLTKFISFDAAIDDYGLWLICKGVEDPDFVSKLKIPGTHVRPAGRRGNKYQFDLFAEPPVRIGVGGDLAQALADKSTPES